MSQLLTNLIQNYRTVLETVAAFGAIILVVLIITRNLLYRFIYAFDPSARSQRFVAKSRPVRVALAIADIIAWSFALMMTGIMYQLPQVTQFMLKLFGMIWNLLPVTIIVVLIAFCFSRAGNELMLSVLGFWYLHHRKKDLDRHRYFDLGNEELAEIDEIHFLDTTFRLKKGGRTVIRPNAYLMHEVFGFTQVVGVEGIGTWIRNLTQNRSMRNESNRDG